MSKAAVQIRESDSAIDVANTNVPHSRASSSFLPATHLPLVIRSQRISNTTRPLVQPKLKIGRPRNEHACSNSTTGCSQASSAVRSTQTPAGREAVDSSAAASSELKPRWGFDGRRTFGERAETPAGYFAPVGLSHGPLSIVDRSDQTEVEAECAAALARQGHRPPEHVSSARIHTGPAAERLAAGLRARAVTVGSDIIFGQREYAPHTTRGRALLAHELTHVRQQARSGPRVALEDKVPFATFESEGSRRAREFSRLTISIVEDALLAMLRRDGANAFLRDLQRQSATDRQLLGQSARLLAAVRARLRGYDLWNAETMLGVDIDHMRSLDDPNIPRSLSLSRSEQRVEQRPARMAKALRRLTFSVVRDPLLEALRRNNAFAFLRRLRAVSRDDRRLLETDSTFLAEIRRYFWGTSLWIVRRLLRFGPRFADLPIRVRELGWAVRDRDTTRVRDLLRAYPELRSEQRTPGVRELLEYEFRRSPDLPEIRRVFAQGESHRGGVSLSTNAAHYDQSRGGGALRVRAYGGTRSFTVARTASEVRVIVRIRFVHTTVSGTTVTPSNRTYHVPDAKRNEWRRQIDAAWNGRFRVVSGATRLPIIFVPVFTESNPHYSVGIVDREKFFRSDMTTWWLHDPRLVAHEFGHMLGAADEYNLPGTAAEVPTALGLSAAERQRSSFEGVTGTARAVRVGGYSLPGIMGSPNDAGAAGLPRHLWLVQDMINSIARRTIEAPFRITRL